MTPGVLRVTYAYMYMYIWRHGSVAFDSSSWEVSLTVQFVVRNWPLPGYMYTSTVSITHPQARLVLISTSTLISPGT